MADFGLIKSFDIDDGQLDDMRRQDCFVLGYELSQIDEMLNRPESISQPFHAENRERVQKSLKDSGRTGKVTWMEGDQSESWMILNVESA